MPHLPHVLTTAQGLRLRHEYFGGLAWQSDPRRIFRLSEEATAITMLHQQPRCTAQIPIEVPAALGLTQSAWAATLAELVEQGVLVETNMLGEDITASEVKYAARDVTRLTPRVPVLKPLWVHLQPFTRCNQHCLHCYCSGGPKAEPFLLDVSTWRNIVAMLDNYGVLDIYVTGGESLLLDEFFDIAEDILDRGMGFGVSTNATVLSERILDRLKALRIGTVQVSLDGAVAATHELIRGAPGSFHRTLTGIDRIGEFSEVVVNTVVNRLNQGELEQVVKLGIDHGCTRFKFFPQKPVGRSTAEVTLNDGEIMGTLVPECARLAQAHDVEIETIDPQRPCGSGSIGFAVDQRAEIFPCIFGVENAAQRCGNLLTDDLNEVWFNSPVLAAFRGEVATPCRRCEP